MYILFRNNRNCPHPLLITPPKQCTKVLAAAESEMKGLVLMAITTGQRIGDIIVLTHGDVDTRSIGKNPSRCSRLDRSTRSASAPRQTSSMKSFTPLFSFPRRVVFLLAAA